MPARLAAVLVVGLVVADASPAQPAAPMPHPALDELVREYHRLGLPIPPPNAELVRVRWDPAPAPAVLALRIPPANPGEPPRYLRGARWWDAVAGWPECARPAEPGPAAVRGVEADSTFFCLAAQCKLRGWDELAAAVYAAGREADEGPPVGHLRDAAWAFWDARVTEPATDRVEVVGRLKALAAGDARFRTAEREALVRDLGLTVAPRKSGPGTAEALIDDLTEYGADPGFVKDRGAEAHRRLAELGFDAAPALIEHVRDPRLTRHEARDVFGTFGPYRLRVGHLASQILNDLSAGKLRVWSARGDMADPGEALKWWGRARRLGEEEWLVAHALLPVGEAGPNAVILRAIRAKYPGRLPELYRALLRERPTVWSRLLAKEIVASGLPRGRKTALLEEGVSHARLAHRLGALAALAEHDPAAFREHLIRTLEWLPGDFERLGHWHRVEDDLAWLVQLSDDPRCWDALAAAARRASVWFRFQFVEGVLRRDGDVEFPPGLEERVRRELRRFLIGFLGDASARGRTPPPDKEYGGFDAGGGSPTLEVRDFAATRLAGLLGIPLAIDPAAGGFERFVLRAAVRKAAEEGR